MQRSTRYIPLITLVGLSIGFMPIAMTPVSSQEWGQSFNPYTNQWEDVDPPSADLPNPKSGEDAAQAPAEVPTRAADETSTSGEDAAQAATEVLKQDAANSTRWLYERPVCPKMHYHKPLPGRDVCSNPLGGDADISCPPGTTLVIDYHPAGSDACRSQVVF